MTTNYVSIKSILYDLSLTIDDRYWNEAKMTEWAHKALRLVHSPAMLESKLVVLNVEAHKATLPPDLKYITQVAYIDNSFLTNVCHPELNLPPNSTFLQTLGLNNSYSWKAMRLSSSPYSSSIGTYCSLSACTNCTHSFSISSDLILTTTLNNGVIMLAYLGYPIGEDGCAIIPDSEELKEAILNYCLYRYWMSKYNMMEDGAETRMKNYMQLWNTLSKKAAGNLNLPDVPELENIKNMFNRLVPRENMYQHLFNNLGNQENVNF